MKTSKVLLISLCFISCTLLCNCGILIGNVKPVEQKASNYGVLNLSKENPDWKVLEPKEAKSNPDPDNPVDVAYQSKKTASIISLNSTCGEKMKQGSGDLGYYTDLLLTDVTDLHNREEVLMKTVQGIPALQTTCEGNLSGEKFKLRTVVLEHKDCVYDLTFVAHEDRFQSQETDFSRFVASLKLKE